MYVQKFADNNENSSVTFDDSIDLWTGRSANRKESSWQKTCCAKDRIKIKKEGNYDEKADCRKTDETKQCCGEYLFDKRLA